MRAVNRWFVAALALVAAMVVVATTVRPSAHAAHAPRGAVAPVAATTLVCPSLSGGADGGSGTTQMTVATVSPRTPVSVSYTRLSPGGRAVPLALRPAAAVTVTGPGSAAAVSATGPGAASVVASQVTLTPSLVQRGLSDVACVAPASDWWFAGADGRIGVADLILLSNPGGTAANVALSLWSEKGPLNPPKADNINLAARSSMLLRASDLAPDHATLAAHVHANSGTVAAAVLDLRGEAGGPVGADWIPATTAPSKTAVVTGYIAGAGYDGLDLANPGDHDATVTLRVLTPTRNFQPAGQQTVVVPAGRTTNVNLSLAAGGEPAAAQLSSDVPVVAAGISLMRALRAYSEYEWLAAQAPLRGPAAIAANAAPFGQRVGLLLTAPAGEARVRVENAGAQATVTVPAGRTTSVDLSALLHAGPAGPGAVELVPLGPQPVYAVRTLYASGAHGPLVTAEMPTVLPAPIVLPPVVADLRAATR
jgi:hypothetical protein